jgi:hypothetical protein
MRFSLTGRTGSGARFGDPPLIAALAAALAVGLFRLLPDAAPPAEPAAFDSRCDNLDQAASAALATMISERNTVTDRHLGDAVFRLQRARRNCRFGWSELARFDYIALLDGRRDQPRR